MKSSRVIWITGGFCLVAGIGLYMHLNSSDTATEGEPGGFSGIVVNGLTDEPIYEASVTAVQTSPANKNAMLTEPTQKGVFDLALSDGSYQITASAPGYTTRGKNDLGRSISVEEQTHFVNGKLRLWPSSSIQGRVIAGNTGISAEVVLQYDRDASGASDYIFQTIKADKDGNFVFSDLYAGISTVSIAAEGFANVELRDTVIKAGQVVDLGEIPLRDGISIYGQITDSNTKRGIHHALISIKNSENILIAETFSDHDGQFRLPATDLKQVLISIEHAGYHTHSKSLQLSGGANRNYNISLKRAWGLSLNVQNQTGREPVKTHVVITDAVSQEKVYDSILANGIYNLDTLKGGPFIIEAESPDEMTKTHLRATTGSNVFVRLRPFGKINVQARNSDGSALTQGEFRYFSRTTQDEKEIETPWTEFTSSEFDIPDLPEGFYRVEIKANKKEVGSHEIKIRNGDVYRLKLQLLEGGVLTGHVVTEQGNNVRATVTLVNDSRTVKTDKEGYFTFDKMPTDAAIISIIPKGKESKEARFTNIVVKENDHVEREFRVISPRTDERAERRARMKEMRERGELPPPPPRGARPPWGDGEPPWGDGEPPAPPWGDGEPPAPPWGDGEPPWGDGEAPAPPWGDGEAPAPPWGDGEAPAPPWGDGEAPAPPWGDGQPPWANQSPNDSNESENNFAGQPAEILDTSRNVGRKKGKRR